MIESIQKIDDKVLCDIGKIHTRFLNKFMVVITKLGNNGIIWFAISLPLILNQEYRYVGMKIIFALLLSGFLGEIIIKHLVGRMRPSKFILPEDMLIKKPRTYSFPSGHTSSSFAAASIISSYNVYFAIPAFILAILIAFSRLYLRVHYPSDVIAGAALGVLSAFLVNAFIAI